jgi:hypothetical protein
MIRKNIFHTNLDSGQIIDNESFVLRRENAEISAKRKNLGDQLSEAIKKSIKQSLLRTLPAYITAGVGMLLGTIAFEIFEKKEKFPAVLGIIAGILIVVGIGLAILNHKKTKAKEDEPDENLEQLDNLYDDFDEEVKKDLGIPADAVDVQFFTHTYSANDKKEKKTVYDLYPCLAFIEEEKFCVWYGEAVIGFPMNEIEALVKVNEPITFDSWMSDDPHDSLKYAQYGIEKKETNYDEEYTMTGFYSLRLTHEEEPFELLFPLFDAEKLLKLLDCEIVEE